MSQKKTCKFELQQHIDILYQEGNILTGRGSPLQCNLNEFLLTCVGIFLIQLMLGALEGNNVHQAVSARRYGWSRFRSVDLFGSIGFVVGRLCSPHIYKVYLVCGAAICGWSTSGCLLLTPFCGCKGHSFVTAAGRWLLYRRQMVHQGWSTFQSCNAFYCRGACMYPRTDVFASVVVNENSLVSPLTVPSF